MVRVVAWDTWAFLESALDGPRKDDVLALLEEADVVLTVRDVVAETYSFIVRRTKRPALARAWWLSLQQSRVRVAEPTLGDLYDFASARPGAGVTSFADLALAYAALEEGAREIATEDGGFRQFKLTPLFARR